MARATPEEFDRLQFFIGVLSLGLFCGNWIYTAPTGLYRPSGSGGLLRGPFPIAAFFLAMCAVIAYVSTNWFYRCAWWLRLATAVINWTPVDLPASVMTGW